MTKMSPLPSRSLAKAILVPSGDQAGSKSRAGLLVRFVSPLPSAFTLKTSGAMRTNGALANATRAASGDQVGATS